MPAGSQEAGAAAVAARREQEHRKLEAMWLEALATDQAAAAWDTFRTPVTFPGSSKKGATPQTNVNTSTPFPPAQLDALRAIQLAVTAPQSSRPVLGGALGSQGAAGTSGMAKAAARASAGAGKKTTPAAAPESRPRQNAIRQEGEAGYGAEVPRKQAAGGGSNLWVQISDADEDEVTETSDGVQVHTGVGESLRRSPRGATKRRVEEHDDEEHGIARRGKKLKSAT